ncbi:uncharacterized protein LOC143240274 isoform X1 [Tachypleus tridentatus]|uniref:uncharacterized protein LOC143240274 isoform X1 n=1 Tax=Tachypleus tridentatus TaxID=6853 RepID=UPI003FD3498B
MHVGYHNLIYKYSHKFCGNNINNAMKEKELCIVVDQSLTPFRQDAVGNSSTNTILVLSTEILNEDEEPLEEDELPEHLRPSPKIDLSNLDTSNPENLFKMSKKGQTLMIFDSVLGFARHHKSERLEINFILQRKKLLLYKWI